MTEMMSQFVLCLVSSITLLAYAIFEILVKIKDLVPIIQLITSVERRTTNNFRIDEENLNLISCKNFGSENHWKDECENTIIYKHCGVDSSFRPDSVLSESIVVRLMHTNTVLGMQGMFHLLRKV